MNLAVLDPDALKRAVESLVTSGQVTRDLATIAVEEIDAAGASASIDQIAFLLDLPADVVAAAAGTPEVAAAVASGSLVGRVFDGFEISAPLGEGAMGTVYRARQLSLRRDVALKLLPIGRVRDPEAIRRFLRERRAVAAVNHPHVVTCYAAGQVGEHAYVAMELLEGGDLESRATRHGGPLPEARALRMIRDACEGLAALEAAGLVHRDIKPANILLTGEGRAKLGDLGLARSRMGDDRVTMEGLVVGTPAYMAPEQGEGAEPDVRADIYGLGATLFRLVTGSPPYSGLPLVIIRQKLGEPPPDPRAVHPALAVPVARLIQRMMARQPAERPASAAALLAEIDATVEALRAPDPAPKRKRNLLFVGLGALALLAPAVGAVVVIAGGGDDGAPPPPAPVEEAAPVEGAAGTPLATPSAPPVTGGATAEATGTQLEAPASPPPPSPAENPAAPSSLPAPRPAPAGWRPASLTPPAGGTATLWGSGYAVLPGDIEWGRVGFVDTTARAFPARARFRLSTITLRDSPAGLLPDQGLSAPGAFFHEFGVRSANTQVNAAAALTGFAMWATLVTAHGGDSLLMLRAIGPNKPDMQLGRGTPGVVVLDTQVVPAALATGVIDATFEVDAQRYSVTVMSGNTPLLEARGDWSAHIGALGGAPPDTWYLWGHAGNWGSGRGEGGLEAFTR